MIMTFGTDGSSGGAGLAAALAREDSQKSGVNGYKRDQVLTSGRQWNDCKIRFESAAPAGVPKYLEA